MELHPITWVIPVAGIAAIAFALYLAWDVLSRDTGTPAMQDDRRHDLRGRGRLHPAPVHDDRPPALGGAVVIGVVIAVVETRMSPIPHLRARRSGS